MKASMLFLVVLLIPVLFIGQMQFADNYPKGELDDQDFIDSLKMNKGYPMNTFSLSFNPLGFFQYGPMISAEIALARNLVFHTHIRFLAFGTLASRSGGYSDFSDAIGHIALGGGPIYFFGPKQWKPYLGLIVDYSNQLQSNYVNGNSAKMTKTITAVYMINAGYRMRFDNGLFINGGAFAGISNRIIKPGSADVESSTQERKSFPFFMAEFAIGFEF